MFDSLRSDRWQATPATPGLLTALGQTFVGPAADLTPEERRGDAGGGG